MIISYPLQSLTVEEAMQKQFQLVDCITNNFKGNESLTRGDLGVKQPMNQPDFTRKAEKTLADFFDSEDCMLVRGSGTGAIRYGLTSMIECGKKILVHDAPIYSTTNTSFEMFGYTIIKADFNDLSQIVNIFSLHTDIEGALIQYSRQKLEDKYDIKDVIKTIKSCKDIPILTDDNYAVLKVSEIGVECGADLSCFSTFKLQGPEGIGCIVGKAKLIDKVRKMHYSGGCQTQGWEALEVLRGLTYAPVMLAVTAKTTENLYNRINSGEVEGIKQVYIANAQSKVLIIEFTDPVAKQVLINAEKYGALPHPVGAESKYDIEPLFYRVSGTFLKSNPKCADYMIRVNPNRAGEETVIKILKKSIKDVFDNE